jgi:rhodanese-related sulfurtransferase
VEHATAINVPMASLATHVDRWLQSRAPLVFVCKSGRRAAQAAARMRGLNHAQAWHLSGGVAVLPQP